jgi:two-component system, OmpR family, sensor histidine kinase VicK
VTAQLNTKTERTEVLSYGSEKIINEELEFFSKAKSRIDICIDCTQPQFAITNEKIKNSIYKAKNRTAKTRCITEITNSNLTFCKELMRIIGELLHLDGVKANFMVSEREYLLTPLGLHEVKSQRRESLANIIYSSAKQIVEQQQYLFDSLWSKATQAEHKITEIEQGGMHYETRIIDNSDEIVKEISHLIASSNELVVCLNSGGMQYSHKHFFDIKKKLLDKQKKGEHWV